jgi:hypothetical protein
LFAANACVAAIKEGCELYKQVKTSFMEVKSTVEEAVGIGQEAYGFWRQFTGFFNKNPKPSTKPVEKKKEKYVRVDETQVKVNIVKQLTEFFRIQEQLAAHIREEEEKSRSVYDPDQNHMEAALNRVMAQQQMAELVVQIRECMVYQSPPEMGALYSEVFEMREIIQEEQEQARLRQEAQERYKEWLRKDRQRNFQAKSAYLVITGIFLLYIWMWLIFVSQLRKI